MIRDLLGASDDSAIEVDVCVVGAGAAGISIAKAFLGSELTLCLIESGGFDLEADTQKLYDGQSAGLPHAGMQVGRLRYFGGTTNHWGGRCAALDETDFSPRDWVPDSGWPIGLAELAPYYQSARVLCGLPASDTPLNDVLAVQGPDVPAFQPDRVQFKHWQFTRGNAPWSFGRIYRRDLERAPNILCLLHANITRINSDPDRSHIGSITVSSLAGDVRQVRAKALVLCCGAIENARLLLASRELDGEAPWNRNAAIGRYYMEHLRAITGIIASSEGTDQLQRIFNFLDIGGVQHLVGATPTATAQQREGLLNCSAVLSYDGNPESGVAAGQEIWRGLKRGRWADDIGDKIWRVISDFDAVTKSLQQRVFNGRRPSCSCDQHRSSSTSSKRRTRKAASRSRTSGMPSELQPRR
jgi:choline dehydrogenase-like flavoprotein